MGKTAGVIAVIMLIVGPALADTDSFTLATELASVIGSEQDCGLSFDQPAIEKYIADHVKADDMSFPSTLQMMIPATRYQFASMSASAKTAQCAQVRRIAKSYGFIK